MPVTTLLLATVLAYSFTPDTKVSYSVKVGLDGFLPLMGGNEGKVDIEMAVDVKGASGDAGNLKSSSEISEFAISFNGTKLPLDVTNVVEYFPKTTITVSPNGKIIATDAPDKKLPVRLPGLDVKHFPDITYVPIELPTEEVEAGKTWTFSRDFGGAPITYTCTAESVAGNVWSIKVKLAQTYKVLETPTYEVASKPEDAVREVTTTMTGEGTVRFDVAAGRVEKADMVNSAVSDVKDLKSGESKQRKLVTTYTVAVKQGNAVVAKKAPSNLWEQTIDFSTKAVQFGRNAVSWIQTAALFGLEMLPPQLEHLRPWVKRWAPWFD